MNNNISGQPVEYIDLCDLPDMDTLSMRLALTRTGTYRLPIISYSIENDYFYPVVNVVFVSPTTSRMLIIVVEVEPGVYQDFYYNGFCECFKPLTVYNDRGRDDEYDEDEEYKYPAGTMGHTWEQEGIDDFEMDSHFAAYTVPKPDPNNEFFKNIFSKGYFEKLEK